MGERKLNFCQLRPLALLEAHSVPPHSQAGDKVSANCESFSIVRRPQTRPSSVPPSLARNASLARRAAARALVIRWTPLSQIVERLRA